MVMYIIIMHHSVKIRTRFELIIKTHLYIAGLVERQHPSGEATCSSSSCVYKYDLRQYPSGERRRARGL